MMTREELLKAAKPTLFNTDMVRAIQDGRKTVTRRVIKHNTDAILNSQYHKEHPEVPDRTLIEKLRLPPHKKGQYLYVRETWGTYNRNWWEADYFLYRADYPEGAHTYEFDGHICDLPKWHPSIHMPKEAARIFLRVTDEWAERLQDIDGLGVLKEGINSHVHPQADYFDGNQREMFEKLWNSTLPKKDLDKYGWDANPWVWVIEFERIVPDV